MSLNLILALAAAQSGPMPLLEKFAGHTWFTSLELPDKYENIVTRYSKDAKGVIVGLGRGQAIGEPAIALRSQYSPTADPAVVAFADQQGDRKLTGKVRRTGEKLVIAYNSPSGEPGTFREELTFINADRTVQGEVFSGEKLMLTYRMRRIDISEPPVVLEGKDPVQLVKGKSVEGKSNITTDYEGFRYRFATAASKQTFLKNAAPYSVQFGGACINMGPLSGRGQPNLFEVHKERLYLFASEGCRKAFLAEPDAYIDQPDQPFTPSNEGAEKGLALLDLAAKAHGVDKLKSILRIENQAYGPADKKHRLDIATWSNFKDEFAEVQSFEGATLVTHMTPTSGWMGTLHNPDGFCDAERNYFARRNMRDIFAILRARRDKRMIVESLEKPGVITTLKEPQVLRVHLRGATTTVFINPVTHLIEGVQHQGRLMRDNYQVVRRFEDYRDVSGAKVPFKETTLWPTGQSTSVAFSKIVGNVPIDLLPVRHPLMK